MEELDGPKKPETNTLKAWLEAEGIEDVRCAKSLVAQDEYGIHSNTLAFGYEDTVFFASFLPPAEVLIEKASGNGVVSIGQIAFEATVFKKLFRGLIASHANCSAVVNEFGEAVVAYNNSKDSTKLGSLNTHGMCGGFVDRGVVSETHAILKCRQCGLRVHIPIGVKTYRDLRQHFKEYNP